MGTSLETRRMMTEGESQVVFAEGLSEIMAYLFRASLPELCLAELPLTMNLLSVLYIHFTSCCISMTSLVLAYWAYYTRQYSGLLGLLETSSVRGWSVESRTISCYHAPRQPGGDTEAPVGTLPRHARIPSRTHARTHPHTHLTETCPDHGSHHCRLHRGCGAPISRLLTFSENSSCYFYHVRVDQTSSAFTTLKL